MLTGGLAKGQNALYDMYPNPASIAVGGIKLSQSLTEIKYKHLTKMQFRTEV